MFACNGILFNHESPVRGETFVSRKITRACAAIALGLQDCLYLGNLDACRDWGHARDYVEAMWLMMQQNEPEDFVIATGITTSVREFVRLSFAHVGISLRFAGTGKNEIAFVEQCFIPEFQIPKGTVVVRVDASYFRPTEVDLLIGDASKARKKLNWEPACSLESLVKEMMIADLEKCRQLGPAYDYEMVL
jgi:GDPmannose 4,6-dehydratase